MPRPCKCRRVRDVPKTFFFKPVGIPMLELEEVRLPVEGLEAIRLADLEGMDMDTAARHMGVSRHTFGRVLRKARRAVAEALVQGNALRVEGGDYDTHDDSSSTQSGPSSGQKSGSTGPGGSMSQEILIAVPSDAPGGLAAAPSAHFGHCDAYTIARIKGNAVLDVDVHFNEGHEHGGCIVPVQDLASKGVKVLVAGGMGPGPLSAMHQMGMDVYYSAGLPTVGEVISSFAEGKLSRFGTEKLCQGGCGHH